MRTHCLLLVSLAAAPLPAQAVWSRIYPQTSPLARQNALMASHDATSQVVVMWGTFTIGQASDAWSLQGDTWTQMNGTLPPRRDNAVLVYDSLRQRLVLFGGEPFDDTWEYDGVSWQQMVTAVHPSARSRHGAAFDARRGVTVVFGGAANSLDLQETWEWDGATWVQRSTATVPPARRLPLMAYDPANGAVVMHGGAPGALGSPVFYDTWTYDGLDWQQRFPSTPPPPRIAGGAMVGDLRRGRAVLIGGNVGDPATWQWDGAEWTASYLAGPALRTRHAMCYDHANGRVVLFGGTILGIGGTPVEDTWRFRTAQPADVTSFGSGCAGTAGTPSLVNAPYEYPWLGDQVHTVVATTPPGGLGALFAVGFGVAPPIDLGAVGMPGCTLLVSPDVVEFSPAIAGESTWALQVPNVPALAGAQFRQQAFVLDAAANTLGLVASNAIEATVGVR